MWLRTLTAVQRSALFRLAHNVVVSDGLLDPAEESMMDALRDELGFAQDVESEYTSLEGMADIFDTSRSRTVAMLNLLRLSYVDGAFEIEEECFLRELAGVFQIPETAFRLMDNWVRRLIALETEAIALM